MEKRRLSRVSWWAADPSGKIFRLEGHPSVVWGLLTMNYIQLTYFQTVAECGSFSEAAARLFVSQPAVSKQIHFLEEEWDLVLFNRQYRSATLTEAGRIMLDYVRRSQLSLNNALDRAREIQASPALQFFNVGMFEMAAMDPVLGALQQYAASRSELSISVENANFFTLGIGLNSHKYDLIITLDNMLQMHSNVEMRFLTRAWHIAYLAENHPLAARPDLSFRDLYNELFLIPTYQRNSMTYNNCCSICLHHGFEPHKIKLVPNVDTALSAVHMCKGIVVLDSCVSIPTAGLRAIPTNVYSPVVLVWNRDDESARTEQIIDAILSAYSENDRNPDLDEDKKLHLRTDIPPFDEEMSGIQF